MNGNTDRYFMPVVFAVLAYEWLVSGLNKLISGTFIASLHSQMLQAMPDMRYSFYANFLSKYGVAHCIILGTLVEAGELFAGLSFAVLAVQAWRGRLHSKWMLLGVAAGVISALMNLNFLFYQGGSVFLNPSDPFDEGIPLDLFMFLIQAGLAVILWKMRSSEIRAQRSRSAFEQIDVMVRRR